MISKYARERGYPLICGGPPNALASAARAPINSVTGAERRRPCRLHAVIRTLVLDRPGTLGRQHPPAFPQSTLGCFHAMHAGALASEPRGAARPYRSAVLALPRSFCPGEPMALGRRRQRSRCRAPPNEFNASAATRSAISGAGTRNASSYRIDAVARSPRSVVAGPLKRPNALASAARAPSISQTDARRRRPCRLHAVIRQPILHSSDVKLF